MARLKIYDKDWLHHDTESLLGQATTLVCLADVKVEERKKTESKRAQQIVEIQKENERLWVEIVDVDRLCSELVCKTQEELVMAKEETDLANKVDILEKKMGDQE